MQVITELKKADIVSSGCDPFDAEASKIERLEFGIKRLHGHKKLGLDLDAQKRIWISRAWKLDGLLHRLRRAPELK